MRSAALPTTVFFLIASIFTVGFLPQAKAQTSQAPTESATGKIRQVFIEQNRAIGEVSISAIATKEFVVTFEDKSQCVLKAVDSKDRLISLDLSSCAQKFDVKAGMSFEPSLLFGVSATPQSTPPTTTPPIVAAPPAPEATKAEPVAQHLSPSEKEASTLDREPHRIRFAIGAAIGAGPSAKFTDGSMTGSNVSFETEFKFNGGTTFYADLRSLEKQNWGFIAAVSHDFEREFSSVKITAGNNSATANASGSKLSVTMTEFNLAYRWNEFYLPFGLNYSHFRFKDDSYTGGYELRGGVGLQLGLGFYIAENLALELWSRATNMTFKMTSGAVTQDFGTGTYGSATLGFKAIF